MVDGGFVADGGSKLLNSMVYLLSLPGTVNNYTTYSIKMFTKIVCVLHIV